MLQRKILLLKVFLILFSLGTSAMAATFSTEQTLATSYEGEIKDFWETGEFRSFQGVDDVRINFARFAAPSRKQCLIIVPGRSEGYLKYKELAYDLARQGFNLFIIDHRGQGLSERMLSNRYKGYVSDFNDYVEDLDSFVKTQVLPYCDEKPYLLAHSMGSAISALYLVKQSNTIQAAVFSSPMISISSGGIPKGIAKAIIKTGNTINNLVANESWYFIGQNDDNFTKFESNHQSQSKLRYEQFQTLYQENENLPLGGVTFSWLEQALNAEQKIFKNLKLLETPVLVIQAGAETIVDNQAQDDFCLALNTIHPQSCPNGKPLVIPGAYHELFFEQDQYRTPTLEAAIAWFKKHKQE